MAVPLSPADLDRDSLSAASRGAVKDPLVSVVVATYRGATRIETCLGSLLDQSLAATDYEVVVVQNGPPCSTPDIVRELRDRFPDHSVRLLQTTEAGVGRARNLGIDAARGTYVTFVDDDDWVSREYLAALLEATGQGLVPVAYIANVPADSTPSNATPDFDNYISSKLFALSGQTVSVLQASVALSANAGKLLPTSIARLVRYQESLASGEDFLFWHEAFGRTGFKLAVTRLEDGAIYYRSMRGDSVSRRAPSYGFNVTERLDCIEILNQPGYEAPDAVRLTRRHTIAQAHLIRDYVASHPSDQKRLRDDIAQRGLQDIIPWRTINAGQARDLAVLYCFTPYLDTSGLVAARRLLTRGVLTDVISQKMDNLRMLDPSSNRVASEILDTVRIIPGEASFSNWELTRTFVQKVQREVADLQSSKGPYRTLYSRAMAVQSHFAAAVVKLRNPDIVWTAEFSDPLLINIEGEERVGAIGDDRISAEIVRGIVAAGFSPPPTQQLFAWAEIIVYALADEIVFTNENQRTMMLGYCHDPALAERARSISSVSHHPTLPERFYRAVSHPLPLPSDVVHIGYFGVFYLKRGLTEVTAALEALSAAERRRVCLHVFTDRPDNLALDVLNRGLSDVIQVHEYVPFLAFLNLTLRFDALLVNDASTADHHALNPYLPSKISDYRGSGTPIWAIAEPGSVLSTMKTEYASSLGDETEATDVLRDLIAAGPRERQPHEVSPPSLRSEHAAT